MRRVAIYLSIVAAVLFIVGHCTAGSRRVETTAYCLHGRMSDGTQTRPRSVAMNIHPLGTKIELLHGKGPDGLKRYVVRDHIGNGSQLDFWVPTCGQAKAWGRRTVSYRLGWSK